MIKCNNWPIGVCSWCLGNDLDKLAVLRDQTGLTHLNLGIWEPAEKNDKEFVKRVLREKWDVTAAVTTFPQEDYTTLETIRVTGGIVPDQNWESNRKRVIDAIDMTVELNVKYLLFHFGFFDSKDQKAAQKYKDKVRELADLAHKKHITLLMETGQESAEDLAGLLEELKHPSLKVNLDPGNMILYNKNAPIDALKVLAPWIKQIHAKDAIRNTTGTWGKEMPWGDGEVGGDDFLRALKGIGFEGALIIEREVGKQPIEDITLAINRIKAFTV